MIEIKNLTKEFKKPIRGEGIFGMFKSLFSRKYTVTTAVNHINLTIPDGQIVGYIGSNGAGKSTTIKMMCGILNPSEGEVLINGLNPVKKRREVAADIGVVFGQKTQLWWDIALVETFKVLKEVYSISDKDYEERFNFLREILELDSFLNQPVRTLSLGQRMRGDLAAAFLHNPKILFLDEPTIGLDVLVKTKIRDAIKLLNKKYGTTVILTTHDMDDISDLCSRIVMIEKGNIIYDGSIKDIRMKFGDRKTIIIPFNENYLEGSLDTFNFKVSYEHVEENLLIKFNGDEIKLEKVVDYIFQNLHATDMTIKDLSLEDAVKEIMEMDERDAKKV